ncbi:P-loop NTPase fold protein [Tenacibaculum soleae]|uniref:KAP family P-loop NTPase fold protein n=1 Tax=Tenacibaculum soleae TaxID=447689 RepID=UPI0026E1C6D4|nr:P-loop NTPase fold protein [Tenacibaculum soleae]MDO6743422.1 P-loop NTPase fold protein [Tenacibaculum soleae]
MSRLLSNLPIENLTHENDYIGIIEKGNLIKSFFLANKQEFSEIMFFAIYGDWGSGKSTLMKYLEKELKGSFNTFFFEAWQFESDANLANSLLEFLAKKSNTKVDNFLKNGSKLLEGFAKSVTFKTPIANFNMPTMIDHLDEQTFFELKEQFSRDFINWETQITKGEKAPKYNIVFIDDLDRCEPENVLNLLSAIKLFFTFGKKTIFLCGIDKKAVIEAVKTKYGEVVKANEYLEKVFDISFSMPQSVDVSKLVNQYFDENEKVNDKELGDLINNFFKDILFQNPRRIKKILNKYLIIKRLKKSEASGLTLPNIIQNNSGTLFETYLTLYLLILNEFEPENYELLFNFSAKRVKYNESLRKNYTSDNEFKLASASILNHVDEKLINYKISGLTSSKIKDVIYTFSPLKVDNMKSLAFNRIDNYLEDFNVLNKSYEYYFTLFIYRNENLLNDNSESEYNLLEYKKMIANLI